MIASPIAKQYFVLTCILVLLGGSQQAFTALSHDPALTWQTLHTQHFRIHFHDGERSLAITAAHLAEAAHEKISTFFAWSPTTPTDLVLTDRNDFSNGSATPFPNNQMTIFVSPPDDINTLEDINNWLELLIIHEYTHIIHLDMASKIPGMLRHVFGRLFPWLFPNALQPRWYVEGLATYIETDQQQGIGRGQSSSFAALMRNELIHGLKPLRRINQPQTSWPAGSGSYLYGVYFYRFIAERYGEEKVKQLVSNYSRSIIPFMLSSNTKHILGKSLDRLWQEFENYLKAIFEPQIAHIKSRGLSRAKQITQSNYFTNHARTLANGDLFFAQNNAESRITLMRRAKQSITAHKIAEVYSNRFDVHPQSGIVIAQPNLTNNTNVFSDLYHIDLTTYRQTRLTQGARYKFASWSPDGSQMIAVHYQLANSSLHLLDRQGHLLKTLWTGQNKTIIADLDWSPDGENIVAAVWRSGSNWNLERFNLITQQWQPLTNTTDIEAHPQFDQHGNLIFSADYGGVYNIYRMNLSHGELTQLTNVMGSALYPSVDAQGKKLYYSGLSADGYNIYQLDLTDNPSHWQPMPAQAVTTPEMMAIPTATEQIDNITRYSPYQSLSPKWWFPSWLVTKNRTEIGFTTSGSDVLKRHLYQLTATYEAKQNDLLGSMSYVYDRWNPTLKLSATRQSMTTMATIADAANNIIDEYQSIRYSEALAVELVYPFLSFESQWGLHTALVYDRQYSRRNIFPGYLAPDRQNTLVGLAVTYSSTQRFPVSISRSAGRQVRWVAESSDAWDSDYSGSIFSLDWSEFFALGRQHVLAWRIASGYGTELPNPFRLGGTFSENLSTTLLAPSIQLFNKRNYPLRGYPQGLRDLVGRRMVLSHLEWRFPIKRIEYGYTAPIPLGIHQLYGSLFLNSGGVWYDTLQSNQIKSGGGFEFHIDTIIGYSLPLNFRLGIARGFNQQGETQMYLSLGSAF